MAQQATQFARQKGFPEHHLVLRPQGQDAPSIEEGAASCGMLALAFQRAQGQAGNKLAFLEDVRAYAHPTRMGVMSGAAEDLASRLNLDCPPAAPRLLDRVAGC